MVSRFPPAATAFCALRVNGSLSLSISDHPSECVEEEKWLRYPGDESRGVGSPNEEEVSLEDSIIRRGREEGWGCTRPGFDIHRRTHANTFLLWGFSIRKKRTGGGAFARGIG